MSSEVGDKGKYFKGQKKCQYGEKLKSFIRDKPQSIVESMSFTAIEIAKILKKIKPDILVLLGDRYELLAAAQASMIYNIPIAHIHGGENILKNIGDEAIRHAITKMSHLHLLMILFLIESSKWGK